MKNMGDRQISRLLIVILCVVIFNIILTVYWLIMDKNNLKQSNLQEQELKLQADYSDQIQPYLESPNILPLTPNPIIDEWDGTDKPHLPWYFKGGTMRPTRARVFPRTRTRSSRIWPDEFVGSDRVEEQLMFVPPYYEYDYAFMKKILLYNDFNGWKVDIGQNEFLSKDCPVNRCLITTKKSEGPIADAIVFRNEYSRPSHKKTHHQVWIMAVVESAYNKQLVVDHKAINWTATYRHDSDIVLPYGRWAYYNPKVTEVNQFGRNYALNKTKHVAMYVSKCDTDNGRLLYAQTLGRYIPVDVYGACGGFQSETVESDDFLDMLDRDYKFYLAFENSNCKDYVTDKFFVNGLQKRNQQIDKRRFGSVEDTGCMKTEEDGKKNGISVLNDEACELATSMMYSEWMLETPENIDNWIAVLCPEGKRCCIIVQDNKTKAVNKYGTVMSYFPSLFPYGCHLSNNRASHRKRTVLDCLYSYQHKKYYILDIIEWIGVPYTDFDAEFRFYFIQSKLSEIPGINEKSAKNSYPFEIAPRMVTSDLYSHLLEKCQFFSENIELDGINFYYPEGLYSPGESPLVLWLKPYMIPEVLQRPVHDVLAQLHKPPHYINLFEHVQTMKKEIKKLKKKKNCSFNREKMEVDKLVEVEMDKDSVNEDEMCMEI